MRSIVEVGSPRPEGPTRAVSGWEQPTPGQPAPKQEVLMAKKARKKKARKNSKANHGKRPNS